MANPLFGQEPNIHARCIGVHDGDSIRVLVSGNQQLKIRLGFIDAPEMGQAFGYCAQQALSELVFSKDVELRVYGLDKHERTLADATAFRPKNCESNARSREGTVRRGEKDSRGDS